jgi:hypothetical protein
MSVQEIIKSKKKLNILKSNIMNEYGITKLMDGIFIADQSITLVLNLIIIIFLF